MVTMKNQKSFVTVAAASAAAAIHVHALTPVAVNQKQKGGPSSGTVHSDNNNQDSKYYEFGSTYNRPTPRPLTPDFQEAFQSGTHPPETQEELGKGLFVTDDWRKAWHTYESPLSDPELIDPDTGFAEYEISMEEIEGTLPEDLVGVLYRNGPGKFGINGERVAHTLDADGLILQIIIPPTEPEECSIDTVMPKTEDDEVLLDDDETTPYERKVLFRSKFVETKAFAEERRAQKFLYRGTFGTAITGPDLGGSNNNNNNRNGLNEDPSEPPLLSKIAANAFRTNIKNTANTQVVAFGGKVLALFEAGLPHAIDPQTLDTLGEDDMGGTLPREKLPVKLPESLKDWTPDFIGGAAHTAHPNVCPQTGNLVGWHWSQLVADKSMEITFTEWSSENFEPVASSTFQVPGCELAPHDMAITDDYIILKVNALTMNQLPFLSGLTGPAASLEMDGRAPVNVHIFPRPTSSNQFEPFDVEAPACFSIHFSHAYEDEETGNLVTFFSGWPPSDSKDFLGAWGGFAPDFKVIPPTFLWKLEINPQTKEFVDVSVAPGSANVCAEHPLVHPNFTTRKAQNVYVSASNIVGDSTAPNGFARLRVEDGDTTTTLAPGEPNTNVDAYWFGTRYSGGEPLIVPKRNGNLDNEREAYLLGMMRDAAKDRAFVAVFDLEKDLKEGPVCKIWLKSNIPHGLHGCFVEADNAGSSVFC